MNELPPPYSKFISLAAPNLKRRCDAVFACVYAFTDRGWTNLAASVLLIPRGASLRGHSGTRLFDIDGVRAIRVRVPAKRVPELLHGIADGLVPSQCIARGADSIRFAKNPQSERYSFTSSTDVHDLNNFGLPFRGHVLQGSGGSNAEIVLDENWAEVRARLPASDPPFASLSAVARDLRIGSRLEHNDRTSVLVVSPFWLALTRFESNHESASIGVEVLSYWPEISKAATLSLLPDVEFVDHKAVMPIGDNSWTSDTGAEGTTVFRKTLQIGESIGAADLSLNYGGRQVEAVRVGLAGARVVAHAVIDSDFRALRSRLFERKNKSDSDRYEEGVAWLLHLCGFSVSRYGYKDVQRATDVVAFFDDSAAIYAECTLEFPSMDKLKDIETRAEGLRTRLEVNYGRSIALVRAIFLPHNRAELSPADANDAHDQARSIYICGDDQEELLRMARRGESADACFAFIAQRGREHATVAM